MQKKIITWWTALFVLASATSLVAHHSLAQFDTTTGVTLKGTVVRFERVNPHSLLYIDVKGTDKCLGPDYQDQHSSQVPRL